MRTLALWLCMAAPVGAAELKDLSWMNGSWASSDGHAEETWSWSPQIMLGMFRLIDNNEPKFCELMTIQKESAGPTLRIRHFDKLLTPWDKERVPLQYALRRASDKEAMFEVVGDDPLRRIVYLRDGESLKIRLEFAQGAPKEFVFKRK